MFEYSDYFISIAFQSNEIKKYNDIKEILFPNKDIKKLEEIRTNIKEFEGSHYTYTSTILYTNSKHIFKKEYCETRDKVNYFTYHIYIFNTISNQEKTFFIAIPFISLAIFLYRILQNNSRGRNFKYQIINIPEFINAVVHNRNLGGALKITNLKYNISGDSQVDGIVLSGSDVIHSSTYNAINKIETIEKKEPELNKEKIRKINPERIRFYFQGKNSGISCTVDKFGYYKFWIRKEAINLPLFSIVMDYFYEQNLVNKNGAFPFEDYLKKEVKNSD